MNKLPIPTNIFLTTAIAGLIACACVSTPAGAVTPTISVTHMDCDLSTLGLPDAAIDEETFTDHGIAGSWVHSNLNKENDGNAPRNINGPSLIRVPDWIAPEHRTHPDAVYYLYFAHHEGDSIRMAWASSLNGPWTLFNGGGTSQSNAWGAAGNYTGPATPGNGVLDLRIDTNDGSDNDEPHPTYSTLQEHITISSSAHVFTENHIASPDVYVDDVNQRIVMYFHGRVKVEDTIQGPYDRRQPCYVSTSQYGLNFNAEADGGETGHGVQETVIGGGYMHSFQVGGRFFGISNGGRTWIAPATNDAGDPNTLANADSEGGLWNPSGAVYTAGHMQWTEISTANNPLAQMYLNDPTRPQEGTTVDGVNITGTVETQFRHPAGYTRTDIDPTDTNVYMFYSTKFDKPEHIYLTIIDTDGGSTDPADWSILGDEMDLLVPQEEWEGGDLPLTRSKGGITNSYKRELRDPGVFRDKDGQLYVVYTGKGEGALGIAKVDITFPGDPTADAGPDQTGGTAVADSDGQPGEDVTLDGSGSSDDGSIASHVWTEFGNQIATGAAPTVNLPDGPHWLLLTVTDNEGNTGTDCVLVDVGESGAANQAPDADAGPDQTGASAVADTDGVAGEDVMLDGSGSSDSDGSISTWVWSEGGSQIATGEMPTVNLSDGSHTITLTVTDDDGDTDTDTVDVAVTAPGTGGGGGDATIYASFLNATGDTSVMDTATINGETWNTITPNDDDGITAIPATALADSAGAVTTYTFAADFQVNQAFGVNTSATGTGSDPQGIIPAGWTWYHDGDADDGTVSNGNQVHNDTWDDRTAPVSFATYTLGGLQTTDSVQLDMVIGRSSRTSNFDTRAAGVIVDGTDLGQFGYDDTDDNPDIQVPSYFSQTLTGKTSYEITLYNAHGNTVWSPLGNAFRILVTVANPDGDNDGMPDSYEDANGLDKTVDDSADDDDGDGASNLDEYHAGTNPQNPNSVFRVTSLASSETSDEVTLGWKSVVGHTYSIHSSENLEDWNEEVSAVPSGGTTTSHTFTPSPSTSNQRFFRIATQRP